MIAPREPVEFTNLPFKEIITAVSILVCVWVCVWVCVCVCETQCRIYERVGI